MEGRKPSAARFAALAVFIASIGFSGAQCIPTSRASRIETFATIRVIAGQGEVGSELRLQEDGERVTAALRDYFGGGKLMETHLKGTLIVTKTSLCRVRLSGSNKDGQVEIDGEITVTRFLGTATRYIGTDVFSQAMSLRRQLPSEAPDVGRLPDNLPARNNFKKEALICVS